MANNGSFKELTQKVNSHVCDYKKDFLLLTASANINKKSGKASQAYKKVASFTCLDLDEVSITGSYDYLIGSRLYLNFQFCNLTDESC